jgi:structural maintenance of chromosome 2
MSAQLSGLSFVYSDPETNFDKSKVKGLVANLISVKDSASTMALEVVAGGKLYNVRSGVFRGLTNRWLWILK